MHENVENDKRRKMRQGCMESAVLSHFSCLPEVQGNLPEVQGLVDYFA